MSDLALLNGPLWPYVMLIVFAVLPNELWRLMGVGLSRGLSETSPLVEWVRMVATVLLSAVVVKLLLSPSGALALVPLAGRLGAIAAGAAAFFLLRRSLIGGVIAAEAVLIASAWLAG
ncbi:MAG: AzlD domain-containing protein [Alsobacter sp.]